MAQRILRPKILAAIILVLLLSLVILNLPAKYHVANVVNKEKDQPAVLGTENQGASQGGNSNNPTTGSVVIGNNNNQSQAQKQTLAQFFRIPSDSLQAGDIVIEKNGNLYIAKNVIDAQNIARHALTNGNLETGAVTSRVLADQAVQSQNLAHYLDIRELQVKDKIKAGTLDLGTNVITDGQMHGNWNFGEGNLTTSGVITAGTISAGTISGSLQGSFAPSGDVNMAGHVMTYIGNSGTNFTNSGGLNVSGNLTAPNILYGLSGTANRVTISTGQSPTIDIAGNYAGQTSITILGTISSGTWEGAAISVPYDGTGVSTFASNYVLKGNGTGALASSLIYDNGTDIGIGTTSPGALLDVNGTAQLRGSSGGTGLYVNSSGNVGIGTTNPAAMLDISSSPINSTNVTRLMDFEINSTNITGVGAWDGLVIDNTGTAAPGNSYFLKFENNDSKNIFSIDQSGNISLSTLVSTGWGTIQYDETNDGGYGLLRGTNMQNGIGMRNAVPNDNGTGIGFRLGITTNSAYTPVSNTNAKILSLGNGWNNVGFSTETAWFKANGNAYFAGQVGIGTTNPTHALEVTGDVEVSGNFIQNGTALTVPDYVFQPDYNLMPLDQLESYVQTNSHLPGVPSAADIQKNGLNTGNMILDLLQQTEQNVLYILGNHTDIQTLTQLVSTNQQGEAFDIATLQASLATAQSTLTQQQSVISSLNDQALSTSSKIALIGTTLDQITANQASDESKLTAVSNTLDSQAQTIASLQTDLQTLQDQMATLQQENQSVLDFATALNTNSLIYKDASGNLDLGEGQLKTAGGFVIETVKNQDPLFGTATIPAGKSQVTITNANVEASSLINLTLESDPGNTVPYISSRKTGQFIISLKDKAAADIVLSWWIMQTDGTGAETPATATTTSTSGTPTATTSPSTTTTTMPAPTNTTSPNSTPAPGTTSVTQTNTQSTDTSASGNTTSPTPTSGASTPAASSSSSALSPSGTSQPTPSSVTSETATNPTSTTSPTQTSPTTTSAAAGTTQP